ncbi:hypothetical protein RYX36_031158 [Vicia faba]
MPLENEEGSDVTFYGGGERFHAHKLVMAARSTAFENEFFNRMEEDDCDVVVTDMEPKLLAASEKYDLPRLKLICESVLCKEISIDFVAYILALTDSHHATELKSHFQLLTI